MPVISEFYGIIVRIYFISNEHNPPHVHIEYGEYACVIEINTLKVLEGYLPNRALKMAKEWINIHKEELIDIWTTQIFKKIKPLI